MNINIFYDKFHNLHSGNYESLEKPERIDYILNYLKFSKIKNNIDIIPYNAYIKKFKWKNTILNCSRCTFEINIGEKNCSICNYIPKHQWNYVKCIEGDTTYQTPYTDEVILRGIKIIEMSINMMIQNNIKFTFCLLRPPGHHSCEDKKAGFCHHNFSITAMDYFNKIGKKTLILDIDAHHGDGTEAEVLKRDYGYYISIHVYGENIYPFTGNHDKNNDKILNVPLPPNSDSRIWLQSYYEKIKPEIIKYNPDIIILSCGLDGHTLDSIVPLHLDESTYLEFSSDLSLFNIPVFSILEGGYHLDALGSSVESILLPFV